MARSKISFDYDAIGDQILRSGWMRAHMEARAERVAETARGRAPVYSGPGRDPSRGSYKEAFKVESTTEGGIRHDRAAGIVTNDDPAAALIEFGARAHETTVPDGKGGTRTIKVPAMPARHVLRSSLDAAAGDE